MEIKENDLMALEIFKGKELSFDKKNQLKNICIDYMDILSGIKRSLSSEQIAKELNCSRQGVHSKFKYICKLLITIEPELEELYENFDTAINLNELINEDWANFIARLIFLYNENVLISRFYPNYVVDKKLEHFYIIQNGHKTISTKIFDCIKNELPIKIEDFAKKLDLNSRKLKDTLYDIFIDRVYIIDDYILSTYKNSFFIAIYSYCTNEIFNFKGSIKDLYLIFKKEYHEVFIKYDINNQADFYVYITTRRKFKPLFKKDKNGVYQFKWQLEDKNTQESIIN